VGNQDESYLIRSLSSVAMILFFRSGSEGGRTAVIARPNWKLDEGRGQGKREVERETGMRAPRASRQHAIPGRLARTRLVWYLFVTTHGINGPVNIITDCYSTCTP